MPQQSKYSNEQFENLFQDIIVALEKHNPSPDLAMMVLGNSLTHVLTTQVAEDIRTEMAEKFCQVLLSSVKK
ncbi:DUF1414 domain-containing protein [Planctobacterium marinum]|uniref:UPF0352 protein MACH26_22970 n=1 Tax=Planctobacterium marinum TaxID=1631968 RepID=A0AA48HL57_9ALTE|nr:UPF0352 protein [Planctobacterium marinum]